MTTSSPDSSPSQSQQQQQQRHQMKAKYSDVVPNSLPNNNNMELELQPLTISQDDKEDENENDNDDEKYNEGGFYDNEPHQNSGKKIAESQTQPQPPLIHEVTFWQAYRGQASYAQALDHFLYPPNIPRSCQLLRRENVAVPACYLLVGLLQGLSSVLTGVLALDLGATEAQQTTIRSLRGLPASFKLFFGFWSDNVPIGGLRRKPYMLAGWLLASLSQLALLTFSDLHLDASGAGCFATNLVDDDNTTATTVTDDGNDGDGGSDQAVIDVQPYVPPNAPSIQFFAATLLLFGIGFWLADVMGDSIVAEKAKLEPAHSRGSIQSACYSYRFFGLMVAAPMSTYLYSAPWAGPAVIVRALALLPLCILPLVYVLDETRQHHGHHHGWQQTIEQCHEIVRTVSSRAVWQPLGFVFFYNLLQVGNAAWREFQRTVLHFTSCQINLLGLVGYVLLYAGILTYKYYLMHWSWRNIYIITTISNGLFSMLQVLLIYNITFGIPAFWFALGDDVFLDFVEGIQFLPTTIMMVHLCPVGSEGASYAMFTTVHNAALNLSSSISTLLLRFWDVSKPTLAAGHLSGLAKLTYLTTALQVSGIFLVRWLPHYKEDLQTLSGESSPRGGMIFLAVTFASIGYSIFVSLMNIMFPGWMGES